MLSYPEAIARIDATVVAAESAVRDLATALGAATAARIGARVDVPAFANAAMDGFALRAADTVDASPDNPKTLEVAGITAAGDRPRAGPPPGAAFEIMTGAPLPAGCDAVVPNERVDADRDEAGGFRRIRLTEELPPGRNVRMASEDYRRGDTVLEAGRLVEPHDVMALAASGADRVDCVPAPRVAIITTGSELAGAGAPDDGATIRDSNGPYLETFVSHVGARLTHRSHAADRPDELDAALAAASAASDVVLTTGGVSAGRYDLIPDAVQRAGGDIMFHKVAIRPGKPLLFARLPNGRLMFGLPGNPIAVAVGMRFFVVPALRRLQGLGPERFHAASSAERIRKRAGLRFFGKANCVVGADARLNARLVPGQESFRIRPLTASNCWLIVPEGREVIEAGELVEVAPLYPTAFLQ